MAKIYMQTLVIVTHLDNLYRFYYRLQYFNLRNYDVIICFQFKMLHQFVNLRFILYGKMT